MLNPCYYAGFKLCEIQFKFSEIEVAAIRDEV